jgi:hypothetical protein
MRIHRRKSRDAAGLFRFATGFGMATVRAHPGAAIGGGSFRREAYGERHSEIRREHLGATGYHIRDSRMRIDPGTT